MSTFYNTDTEPAVPPPPGFSYNSSRYPQRARPMASADVEAFIVRCRQDTFKDFRQERRNDHYLDSTTTTALVNMLTDVNARCRTMESQLTELQRHAQEVTSKLDSISSSRQGTTASPSVTSVPHDHSTLKAIRKLQWKIFDLQRENEVLQAMLEMQQVKDGETEQDESTVQQDANISNTSASSLTDPQSPWKRLGPKSRHTKESSDQCAAKHGTENESPKESHKKDTRVVHLMKSPNKLNIRKTIEGQNDCGHDSRITSDSPYPEDILYDEQVNQNPQADGTRSYKFSNKWNRECVDLGVQSRYPNIKWVSPDRQKLRKGPTPCRQALQCKPCDDQPHLYTRQQSVDTRRQSYTNPRYQPTLKVYADDCVHNTKMLGPGLTDTNPASAKVLAHEPDTNAWEYVGDIKGKKPNPPELTNLKLEEFNLYAAPEDVKLVQGTLDLLNSIRNLEYNPRNKKE